MNSSECVKIEEVNLVYPTDSVKTEKEEDPAADIPLKVKPEYEIEEVLIDCPSDVKLEKLEEEDRPPVHQPVISTMDFSPSRVVARLAAFFPPDPSPLSRHEAKIADAFRRVLEEAFYSDSDVEEDDDVELRDEDGDVEWTPDADDEEGSPATTPTQKAQLIGGKLVTQEQMQKALNFYRSAKSGHRKLSCMSARFTWIRTDEHLRRLRDFEKAGQLIVKEIRVNGYERLADALRAKVMEAIDECLPMQDSDLREMAFALNAEHHFVEDFRCSRGWLLSFKKSCSLRSGKITSFVL